MVKLITCIPINVNKTLKEIQENKGQIINVYPILDSVGATIIHIIYRQFKK